MLTRLIRTIEGIVPEEIAPYVGRAVGLALILLMGFAASLAISFVFGRAERLMLSARLTTHDERGEYAKRVSTLLKLLKTIALTLNWSVVVVTMLSHAGLDVTPILASAGILGLAGEVDGGVEGG